MKDESGLKSKLMAQIKLDLPKFVALRHEDVRTAGIPDLSLTGFARTTWWEFKHATPDFESHGIQELTMLRLAAAGFARYVIWQERGGVKRTLIVHPKHIRTLLTETSCSGHDYQFLTDYMRKVHEG
jgi:hypothetical protein